MKKIFISGNYLLVQDNDSNRVDFAEPKGNVRAFSQDNKMQIKLNSDVRFFAAYSFDELLDSAGDAFVSEAALNTFLQENTGFNPASGGSGAVTSVNGQTGAVTNLVSNSTVGEPSGSDSILKIVSLTQAEYDAGTPVSTTLYVITD